MPQGLSTNLAKKGPKNPTKKSASTLHTAKQRQNQSSKKVGPATDKSLKGVKNAKVQKFLKKGKVGHTEGLERKLAGRAGHTEMIGKEKGDKKGKKVDGKEEKGGK
ncbi:MAG: hypothetical protein M1831_006558 [Alyxoria varia]|nr:MAG: hypothetical protein M1831_006558 [Alyxoria varia]